MSHPNRAALWTAIILAIFALGLSGCATGPQVEQPGTPGLGPALPPAFPPHRILILRWMDPEIQGRYGTMVYVRCGAAGAKPAATKPKPKPNGTAAIKACAVIACTPKNA